MADSNYGTMLFIEASGSPGTYSAIGQVTKLTLPELMTEEINTTHHDSGGYAEFIPSGVVEVGTFVATMILSSAALSTLWTNMSAGTVGGYCIEVPGLSDWEFDAFVKSIKPTEADAQSPGYVGAEVTFRPTGAVDLNLS